MDEFGRKALLFDFYGPLLTARQREVYDLAHSEDMSLAEIAVACGISRQAVYDLLKRTDKILENYEHKLGLVAKFAATNDCIASIWRILATPEVADKEAAILREIAAIDSLERE